eukprot:8470132-Lingulodinium_polyedra.AAC.1
MPVAKQQDSHAMCVWAGQPAYPYISVWRRNGCAESVPGHCARISSTRPPALATPGTSWPA